MEEAWPECKHRRSAIMTSPIPRNGVTIIFARDFVVTEGALTASKALDMFGSQLDHNK